VACRGGERPASSETGAAPAPALAGRLGRGKGSPGASLVASPGAPLDSSIATEREWWGEEVGFAVLVYHQ